MSLPLVVQVGFAGVRNLYDSQQHPTINSVAFEEALQQRLKEVLATLPTTLGLEPQHFLCGISQLAIGADFAFTRACMESKTLQRILLPQHRDGYFTAVGSAGKPDFTPEQQLVAERLLASEHIIQQRMVSDAPTRHERFRDCNLEFLRVCSALICLVRADQAGRAGGTQELIDFAAKRKIPVLVLTLSVGDDGLPRLATAPLTLPFQRPTLPDQLRNIAWKAPADDLPSITDYCEAVKAGVVDHANSLRKNFERSAFFIILAHMLATALSMVVVLNTGDPPAWLPLPALLWGELVLLMGSFWLHRYLHKKRQVQRWALFRLIREVIRSLKALGNLHIYPEHLFALTPHIPELRGLLRTLNVLHLRSTRHNTPDNYAADCKAYLKQRMEGTGSNNQIRYHTDKSRSTEDNNRLAQGAFKAFSIAAMGVTVCELLMKGPLHHFYEQYHWLGGILGFFAVMLPVAAVAGLSLAAAFDWEATHYESASLKQFLVDQQKLLEQVGSFNECKRLVLETESRLLSKELNWFTRRSFLGVT
jgi:hypothetical protein